MAVPKIAFCLCLPSKARVVHAFGLDTITFTAARVRLLVPSISADIQISFQMSIHICMRAVYSHVFKYPIELLEFELTTTCALPCMDQPALLESVYNAVAKGFIDCAPDIAHAWSAQHDSRLSEILQTLKQFQQSQGEQAYLFNEMRTMLSRFENTQSEILLNLSRFLGACGVVQEPAGEDTKL